MATPTSVYRYYDASGVLIYVGITRTGIARNRQHNSDKEWWALVAAQEVDHCESVESAHVREIELIRKHRPPFNQQHNPDYVVMRATYLAAQSSEHLRDDGPKGVFPREQARLVVDVSIQGPRRVELRTRLEHAAIVRRLEFTGRVPVKSDWSGYCFGDVRGIEKNGPLARLILKIHDGYSFDSAVVWLRPIDAHGERYQINKVRTQGTRFNNEPLIGRRDAQSNETDAPLERRRQSSHMGPGGTPGEGRARLRETV